MDFRVLCVRHSLPVLIVLILAASIARPAAADGLEIKVHGLEEPLLTNVESSVQTFRIAGNRRLTSRKLEQLKSDTEQRARVGLRPFGYYHPTISTTLTAGADRTWTIDLTIDKGPPVLIREISVDIHGPGAGLNNLQRWKSAWPLGVGAVLDQTRWDELKQEALDLAEYEGFMLAEFTRSTMEVDLLRNEARLELSLDTGPQAVMGEVTFNQDIVEEQILSIIPRFEAGEAYNAWLVERFRIDLWNTGYFNNLEVVEQRQLDESPPRVDFNVNLTARNKNTYQGTLGYGSNTGPRFQLFWRRHLISKRGDSLGVGLGWQDNNDELQLRINYRLPRKVRAKEFWTADGLVKRERQEVRVKEDDSDQDFIDIGSTDVEDYSLRLGRLKVYDVSRRHQQIFENLYVEYLREKTEFNPLGFDPARFLVPVQDRGSDFDSDAFEENFSIGVDWDWPVVRGNAFETVGHHERAWLFTSNTAWGSDRDFTQAYFSSRWNFIASERWKFLFRGEVGYTRAHVQEVDLELDDRLIRLSITDLPNLYRFKAGGSNSVRGYGWETLSNNGVGSNNTLVLSAELEMKLVRNWSLAAFFDAGNAFNDWDEIGLKRGAGVGVRWYTIAGAIRVDVAQALDIDGNPWRFHFTIGTPLL
jgi:translocation and assembly module TamA